MIDSGDMNKFFKTIIQPNIKFLGLIIILFILAGQYLERNFIFLTSIVILIFINYKDILGTFQDIKEGGKRTERVIEDNKRVKKEIHFSEE